MGGQSTYHNHDICPINRKPYHNLEVGPAHQKAGIRVNRATNTPFLKRLTDVPIRRKDEN